MITVGLVCYSMNIIWEVFALSEKIEDLVFNLVESSVEELGLELVSVEYVKEGASWYLRIFIDKEDGVDLDDCERASRKISDLLDEKDPISQAYFLEVSSPGIERVLQREKDFVKFRDYLVNVQLYAPWEGQKKLQGLLGEVTKETLNLILDNDCPVEIPRKQIAQVRLAWVD